MYKRSFVSVSVSSQKLKLVKLSSDGKKVVKAVTYDIPEGLVEQGRVQKAPEFAALVKQVWKRERIREKTVGIVVPEFSTFMKTLNLPKLAAHELDEAVRWQAREFLPHEGAEMILDWKIIGETKENVEVLLVAIEVDVLSGFVGALDAAGLLPVFVETTSLCLERLAESKDTGKLVLYRSRGTIVATVTSGKKILATSVLSGDTDSALLTGVMQIMSRFGRNEISTLSVCGNGLSQEFVNSLHVKSGLPIELLKLNVTGISEAQIQDYIIALSQQSIDAHEPSNEYSINLLPPSWVVHYKNQVRDLRIWTVTLVGSVVMWTCFLISLAAYVMLSQRATDGAAQKQVVNTAELQSVSAEITKINTLTTKVDNLTKSISYPQTIINLIATQKKEGVVITGYDINVETGKVSVSGKAAKRENLLSYKNGLENIKEFSKVTLPLTSLLTDQDISFTIQLDYKKI